MSTSSGDVNTYRRFRVYDAEGNLQLAVGDHEWVVIHKNGPTEQFQDSDWIVLADGLAWNPSLLDGANPVLLTVCAICQRKPPPLFGPNRARISLLSVRNSRACIDCGATTCPSHRVLTGEHWRCPACARLWRMKRGLRQLFFTREEVE